MSVLLVSLGKSWAVVPEAFHLPDVDFDRVAVLTTASPEINDAISLLQTDFRNRAPHAELTITRCAGIEDITTEENHKEFEEILYRWFLQHKGDSEKPYVCLAGGFKTMSAAMQKAAAVLGAEMVYHVLCSSNPRTSDEVDNALRTGSISWVRLGRETGWPQFLEENSRKYPLLEEGREKNCVRLVSTPDQAFRQLLDDIVTRSHRIADSWDRLPELPFQVLATWPEKELRWLQEPLDPQEDRKWVSRLPKIELHCHFGGFATEGKLLRDVRSKAENPESLKEDIEITQPSGWPEPDERISLVDYMMLGDRTGSRILVDPGCLKEQCRSLYNHLLEQRVIYAEIRCSPANYARPDQKTSPWVVLKEIRDCFQILMMTTQKTHEQFVPHVNLILIATRKPEGEFRAAISRHLALAITAAEHWTDQSECRVVGVDLAGFENEKVRPHYFRQEFSGVHRCGLAVTVHAGENDDEEAIWSAVFDLNTRRLGHALHLRNSGELIRSVAARGIGVEMCPYANYQIHGFRLVNKAGIEMEQYPLKEYLEHGIEVSVNTDNIGISGCSLTDNLLFAARLCPNLTRMDVLRLQSNSINTAFISPKHRKKLRKQYEIPFRNP